VVLDDSLPGEGRFVSATPSRGTCSKVPPVASSDTVTCALGRIGVNAQATRHHQGHSQGHDGNHDRQHGDSHEQYT